MEKEELKHLIYQRFIEPTKRNRDVYAGVEIELPIVNLSKGPVDFDLVHQLTLLFKERFDFRNKSLDENSNICALDNVENGDIYTYDCSYNTIEFSFGKESNLHLVEERFKEYYSFCQDILHQKNHILTGFGVNPYRKYNSLTPIPNGRYRMLYNHLLSYYKYEDKKEFHNMPEFGMFTAASQVQIDVFYDKLIPTIKAFSQLEPIKGVLFSNSVLNGENLNLACSRDMLWEDSLHGIFPKNVGIYNPVPENVDQLIEYMFNTPIYCTEHGGKYINFPPIPIADYFSYEELVGEYIERNNKYKMSFKPSLNDFNYFRSFKFIDLTFRGTLEFRSVCTQPVKDSMVVPAFHLGLINKVDELNEIFNQDSLVYNNGYSLTELRKIFIKSELPNFIDKNEFKKLLVNIIDLSSEGLKERGKDEDKFLKPLYKRAKSLENPANIVIKHLNSGKDIEDLIFEFAKYGQ